MYWQAGEQYTANKQTQLASTKTLRSLYYAKYYSSHLKRNIKHMIREFVNNDTP